MQLRIAVVLLVSFAARNSAITDTSNAALHDEGFEAPSAAVRNPEEKEELEALIKQSFGKLGEDEKKVVQNMQQLMDDGKFTKEDLDAGSQQAAKVLIGILMAMSDAKATGEVLPDMAMTSSLSQNESTEVAQKESSGDVVAAFSNQTGVLTCAACISGACPVCGVTCSIPALLTGIVGATACAGCVAGWCAALCAAPCWILPV